MCDVRTCMQAFPLIKGVANTPFREACVRDMKEFGIKIELNIYRNTFGPHKNSTPTEYKSPTKYLPLVS